MSLNESLGAFTWALYKGLAQDESTNIFFAPYSIAAALAMTLGGTKNNTAQQISKVMQIENIKDIHTAFQSLNEAVLSPNSLYTLRSANRLYVQEGYDLLKSFMEITEVNYQASLVSLDFKRHANRAISAINDWVSKQTANKINDLIAPGQLDSLTRLVLVNAVYFKGIWSIPFEKRYTYQRPFHISPTKMINVATMSITDYYQYFEDPICKCQVLSLPYKGKSVRMVILLPNPSENLTALESKINPELLSSWTKASSCKKVHVFLPRFKLESSFTLNDQLSTMGITDLFDGTKADLSGIAGTRDLFVSKVIHKAFVEVNEEGTEAAAATEVMVMLCCEEIATFKADRPFIFLIVHSVSDTILFIGRIVAPEN